MLNESIIVLLPRFINHCTFRGTRTLFGHPVHEVHSVFIHLGISILKSITSKNSYLINDNSSNEFLRTYLSSADLSLSFFSPRPLSSFFLKGITSFELSELVWLLVFFIDSGILMRNRSWSDLFLNFYRFIRGLNQRFSNFDM